MEFRNRFVFAVLSTLVLIGLCSDLNAQTSNRIARLSQEQYEAMLGFIPPKIYVEPPENPALKSMDFPERFDWREMNGVTPVRDQGQCGSCWAFAAMAVLESQVYIATGVEVDYSEQQLVDCVPDSYGCNGGDFTSAWEYLKDPGAILESDYPYQAQDLTCMESSFDAYVRIVSYQYINASVESIKATLQDFGPVATVIAANDNLKNYTGGCFQDSSEVEINHGVTIVGWDDTICDGGSWIVKNSWGEDWGENGYFYIHRGDLHIGDYAAIAHFETVPAIRFSLDDFTVNDQNNHRLNAGESATISIVLKNVGRETAQDMTANLETNHPDISIMNNSVILPQIEAKATATIENAFQIQASANLKPADPIEFTLTIYRESDVISELTFSHYSGPLFTICQTDFEESDDNGWTHGFTHREDDWMRGMTPPEDDPGFDPKSPHSGENLWGNNIGHQGYYKNRIENHLLSPVIDCSGFSNAHLAFWRWLTVEKAEYDQARIYINDTIIWENPVDVNLLDKRWTYCVLDITEQILADPQIQIRFTLTSDEGLTFGGWNIDDLSIFTGADDAFQAKYPVPVIVDISTSHSNYRLGDEFRLVYKSANYREAIDIQDWLILDVLGEYWFWPNWTQAASCRTRTLPEFFENQETILEFIWPDISGHASNIRFWGAVLDPNSNDVLSYDLTEFSW